MLSTTRHLLRPPPGWAIPLAAAVLSASAVSAQDARFTLELEAGPAWQSYNDVEIPNDGSATRFSLSELAGSGPWPAGRVYLTWQLNERHGIRVLLAPFSLTETGTSTEHRDAWFFGYTADLIAGVWIGRDDFTPIGAKATGGNAALPVWLQFMQSAHPATAPRGFEPPGDIIFVRANELTGQPASPGAYGSRLVPFARGTVPPRFLGSADPQFAHK